MLSLKEEASDPGHAARALGDRHGFDDLTQLVELREAREVHHRHAGTAVRHERELAAAMLDIDKFKNINDSYGHGVGDEVIRTVAARVREKLRSSDVLGRYGGEEFVVILADVDAAEAVAAS